MLKVKDFGAITLTLKPNSTQSILGDNDSLNQVVDKNVIRLTDPIKIVSLGPYQIVDNRIGDQIGSGRSANVNTAPVVRSIQINRKKSVKEN